MESTTDSPPARTFPDWSQLGTELHCPRCGYNLRGLPQPRCPECGLEFTWDALIREAELRSQSPLFEYHWRTRPVRSLLRTFGRALLPWRLWCGTRITHEPRPGPLIALLAIALIISAILRLVGTYGVVLYCQWWNSKRWGTPVLLWPLDLTEELRTYILPEIGHALFLTAVGVVVLSCQRSINRYHIRLVHIGRVLALAGLTMILWRVPVELGLAVWQGPVAVWSNTWPTALSSSNPICFSDLIPIAAAGIAISLGLSQYLCLSRGKLMGWLSTVLVTLALITPGPVLIILTRTGRGPWLELIQPFWPGLASLVEYLLLK